jgi:hypothetical protein
MKGRDRALDAPASARTSCPKPIVKKKRKKLLGRIKSEGMGKEREAWQNSGGQLEEGTTNTPPGEKRGDERVHPRGRNSSIYVTRR